MASTMIGLHKSQLDTPCLLLDNQSLQHNLKVMQAHVQTHHKHYRPHCKTHKSSNIAKQQLDYGAIGLSVTLISEAEGLVNAGLNDILITSPLTTANKLNRLAQIGLTGTNLITVLDNIELAHALNAMGQRHQLTFDVLIDVDGGIGRTGISAHQVIDFANKLKSMHFLNLRGIQCYAGHLQHVSDYHQRKQASLATMQQASMCLDALKAQGFAVDILTGGGTGTYDIDVEVAGVTEIQPGSYVVMDVEYQAISSKQATTFSTFKPAMTLLSAVVSVNQADYVTVDAGTKAIYVDNHHFPQIISHQGLIFDWAGFGDEHGKVTVSPGAQKPVLGEYVEMIVPHCDPTINLYENYYLMEKDVVIDVIPIDLRGH